MAPVPINAYLANTCRSLMMSPGILLVEGAAAFLSLVLSTKERQALLRPSVLIVALIPAYSVQQEQGAVPA